MCTKPIRLYFKSGTAKYKYKDGLEVPCGKCLACRIAKRNEWSLRLLHELDSHDDAIFSTLTYSPEKIPACGSLLKSDLQKFFKRLRRDISPKKIKYFACGEYGKQTFRPHYHAIIYGVGLKDKNLIDDNWQQGHTYHGLVEINSIRYVAQYIDDKLTGEMAYETYIANNLEAPFRLSSLGLGASWCDSNADQLKAKQTIRYRGINIALPRYYLKRLELDTSERLKQSELSDCDLSQHIVGLSHTSDELYRFGSLNDNLLRVKTVKDAKAQHDRNLQAKIKLTRNKI